MFTPQSHRRHRSSTSVVSRPPSSGGSSRPASQAGSLYSPISRRNSRSVFDDSSLLSPRTTDASSPTGPGANGLGNLADELAEAWDDDEDHEADGQLDGGLVPSPLPSPTTPAVKYDLARIRDSGIDVSSPNSDVSVDTSVRRPLSKHSNASRPSTRGRDEGPDELPRDLLLAMKDIDVLANGNDTIPETPDAQDSVTRLVTVLRGLGNQQSRLEGNATRLITAHTSLSMNIAHQSRSLQSLTYYFSSPLSNQVRLDEEQVDELLEALADAMAALPYPATDALAGLGRIFATSKDAALTLSVLVDTLHLSRQTSLAASHKLKTAKDMVASLRAELNSAEAGAAWLARGDWDRRLGSRACAAECRDIVRGFAAACGGVEAKVGT